ncbi:MAG TPA: TonB-dependent receptor [Steroidobacteraceae bacterium]|nr:TonB-dependent receptor [Steroidobacteraceae bacterium]
MRNLRLASALSLALLTAATGVLAEDSAAPRIAFSIAEQPLSSALTAFAKQARVQILSRDEDVLIAGKRASAISGELGVGEALERLLANTGLGYEFIDARTVRITPATPPHRPSSDAQMDERVGRIRLAEASPGAEAAARETQRANASDDVERAREVGIEEIVVTAQKRAERLMDVPIPVTAIDAQFLLKRNELRLQDYYSRVPGLNYAPGQWGEPRIAIRGIVTDPYTNPTVGLMIDDIPYGLSINQNGGGGPDIDPGDLARIEVLRGPQGTLYGASSMGGLLKYVTVDPSTDALSGRVQIGSSSVRDGDDLGYSVRGSVNLPVSESWALRASAFTRREPGYIDNVQTSQPDINEIQATGGRVAALWRPSDDVSLKLSAMVQKAESDGSQVVEPDLGGLRHSLLPTAGQYERGAQAYSAILSADFGSMNFASLTGYSKDSFRSGLDVTAALGPFAEQLFGVPFVFYKIDQDTKKFSQEFRISMPLGERFEWLFGAFYNDERIVTPQVISAADATATPVGTLIDTDRANVRFREYAAFTDLTIHLTERFDLQIGGRQSWTEQRNAAQAPSGPFAGPATPELEDKGHAFTYLLTPQLRISPELMVYARVASGYRPGGINFYNPVLGALPPYESDETRNYEVGVKGSAFDRLMTFDASVYYIDWDDIQLVLTNVISFYDNAGGARSRGVELSTEVKPAEGLTLSAWGAWGEAEITEDFPDISDIVGGAGDRLPYSPKVSGSLALDYEFDFIGRSTATAGAVVRYVGDRAGSFRADAGLAQPSLPSYSQVDLSFGVAAGPWTFSAFVNNVADKRGVTGIAPFNINAFNYILPRTIGVTLARTF